VEQTEVATAVVGAEAVGTNPGTLLSGRQHGVGGLRLVTCSVSYAGRGSQQKAKRGQSCSADSRVVMISSRGKVRNATPSQRAWLTEVARLADLAEHTRPVPWLRSTLLYGPITIAT
jgi:hypothetical protein